MDRTEISNGVFYTSFDGHYKKNRLSIHLKMLLSRENITETALLPFLLERGCETFPDMTEIKRRLNNLYGATLYTSCSSVDYARILSLSIEGVDEKYLPEKGVARSRAELLTDVLFHPVIESGGFKSEWMDIEREKHRLQIESEINNKRSYCLKKANELFFENDERSLPQNGFAEDLDNIDGKRLYEVYLDMLRGCTVEIINIGSDSGEVRDKIAAAFAAIERKPIATKEKKAVSYGDEKSSSIYFDVEQGKYAMIYTAGRLFSEREQTVFRVANLLLGGAPTSRLFLNVREKESLCYYCASRPGFMSAALTVDSGIETENAEKMKAAVQRELDDIAAGNISDKELSEMKLMLKNTLTSVEDTIDGLGGWYLNSLYRLGHAVSPQQEIENVMSVTKEEIAGLMGLFELKAEMLLGKEGN